jgi:hypothetical protein
MVGAACAHNPGGRTAAAERARDVLGGIDARGGRRRPRDTGAGDTAVTMPRTDVVAPRSRRRRRSTPRSTPLVRSRERAAARLADAPAARRPGARPPPRHAERIVRSTGASRPFATTDRRTPARAPPRPTARSRAQRARGTESTDRHNEGPGTGAAGAADVRGCVPTKGSLVMGGPLAGFDVFRAGARADLRGPLRGA